MTAPGELPVAVIGAGGSGLLAAAALRRAGVDFEVLEARDGIGGTWRYDEHGAGSACYASLVANTSKLRTSVGRTRISGRPWQYAKHSEMLAHVERVADDEELRPQTRLNWRVAGARHDDAGWTLVEEGGEERRYGAVICALGVCGRPRFAALPGDYSGEQFHTAEYRTPDPFAGKDVVVIGIGTSGCEVAGEVAATARRVIVSVRSPLWLMTRRLAGVPIDWVDNPWVARVLPWSMRRPVLAGLCRATTGRLHRRGLPRPARRCGDDIIAISDTFPRAVRRGRIEFRPDIRTTERRRVEFADGSAADADVIVHATGYEPATDFLPAAARPTADNLYRGIAHDDFPDLFFVGMIEAHRALLPIVQDQAAWVADLLSGRIAPPAGEDRRRRTAEFAQQRRRDFGDRHAFLVDHARYRAMLRRDRAAPAAAG